MKKKMLLIIFTFILVVAMGSTGIVFAQSGLNNESENKNSNEVVAIDSSVPNDSIFRFAVFEGYQKTVIVGQSVKIPKVKFTVPVDVKSVNTSAFYKGIMLDSKNSIFIPTEAGQYSIAYRVVLSDGKAYSYSLLIQAEYSDLPVFENNVVLPNGFISGKAYKLPKPRAYKYSDSGAIEQAVIISAIDSFGESYNLTDDIIVPLAKIANGDIVTIKYEVSGNSKVNLEYEVPVIKLDSLNAEGRNVLNIEKLFISKNINEVNPADTNTEFSFNSNASLDFASKLYSEMELEFTINADYNDFNSMDIFLTDSLDSAVSLKFSIVKSEIYKKTSKCILNDGQTSGELNGNFYGTGGEFYFSFSNSNRYLKDASGKEVFKIRNIISGEEFLGFPSKSVFLKIEFNGVKGVSKINIRKLNSQFIATTYDDVVNPTITRTGKGEYELDKKEIIPKIFAYDVIDPNLKGTVTIIDENKNYVSDTSGNKILNLDATNDLEVVFKNLGNYNITYKAQDAAGNQSILKYSITVAEYEAPKLNLSGGLPLKVKYGEKLKLPTVNPTDNVTASDKLKLMITLNYPDNNYVFVSSGEEIAFSRYGKHRIKYIVYDEQLNYDYLNFDITVE